MSREEETRQHATENIRLLAKEYLDTGNVDRLTAWLTDRAAWLPLLSSEAPFQHAVERMDRTAQHSNLQHLPGDLLDTPEERKEWQRLSMSFRDAAAADPGYKRLCAAANRHLTDFLARCKENARISLPMQHVLVPLPPRLGLSSWASRRQRQ